MRETTKKTMVEGRMALVMKMAMTVVESTVFVGKKKAIQNLNQKDQELRSFVSKASDLHPSVSAVHFPKPEPDLPAL